MAIHVLTRSSADTQDLPAQIQGLPVSAIVTGDLYANASHKRQRPLAGGIVISKAGSNTFGTLGGIVTDTAGSALALTCFHVLTAGVCSLSTSANVVQPDHFSGGAEIVASVARYFLHGGSAGQTGIDAVVAKIPSYVPAGFQINTIGGIQDEVSAALGETVRKVGIGSDLTYGTVTGIGGTLSITYDWGTFSFFNQISITATAPSTIVSTSGDSGAIWVNSSNRAIGLNFASTTDHTIAFAQPFQSVADRLGFTVPLLATAEASRTYRVRAD